MVPMPVDLDDVPFVVETIAGDALALDPELAEQIAGQERIRLTDPDPLGQHPVGVVYGVVLFFFNIRPVVVVVVERDVVVDEGDLLPFGERGIDLGDDRVGEFVELGEPRRDLRDVIGIDRGC